MKSVWEIRPPESWEKRFGKHPTQKPVALLERILLASTNEGDFVLDPFAGSSTTLLAAFRLRRNAVGCELSAEFLSLSIRRICSEMVQIELSVSRIEFSLDLDSDPMDRSCSGRSSDRLASASERSCVSSRASVAPFATRRGTCFSRCDVGAPSSICEGGDFSRMSPQLQLVQQERRFYFIGRTKHEILFTVLADSLDEARQEFRNAGHPDSDALFIIKTETEIYLA
jgi:hypothetical protein